MTQSEPEWTLYRTFLDVIRHGSLSGAARRLALTQPTVGRQIEALEMALGVALFTRSPRGLRPTSSALELVPHAEAMATACEALLRTASAPAAAETGTVRVTASEIIGCEVLPSILAGFRTLHPKIVMELAPDNKSEDLLQRGADVAVRMVRPSQNGLVARQIGTVSIGLFGRRDYLARYGVPQSLAELEGHCLIGFDRDSSSYRSLGPSVQALTREAFGFRCDNDLGQLAALRAGLGLGGCQIPIAARSPNLIRVLTKEISLSLDIWIVMHEDQKATHRVRLLFDYIASGLTAYLAGATGDY